MELLIKKKCVASFVKCRQHVFSKPHLVRELFSLLSRVLLLCGWQKLRTTVALKKMQISIIYPITQIERQKSAEVICSGTGGPVATEKVNIYYCL